MTFDKWGLLYYSNIELKIPELIPQGDGVPSGLLDLPPRQKIKEIAVVILNRFLEIYRYATSEFQVTPLSVPEMKNFYCEWLEDGDVINRRRDMAGTGLGSARLTVGTKERPFSSQIDLIKSIAREDGKIPIEHLFLLDAKNSFLIEDYISATLFSIFALEITANNFIKERAGKRGWDKNKIDDTIRWKGLTKKVKKIIPSLLDDKEEFNSQLFQLCLETIQKRNDIAHKGIRKLSRSKTDKRIISIIKYIEFLEKIVR